MTATPRSARPSLALTAALLAVAGCAGGSSDEAAPAETSTASTAEVEGGVSYEPGLASCEFNNEMREDQGDGSGVSPFGEMDRVELREEPDAYVVTMTGDLLTTEVFETEGAYANLQIILSPQDSEDLSRYLVTEYWETDMTFSGTKHDGDAYEQDTGATLEGGTFTATFPKDSPHLEDFEVRMWAANVSFSLDDEDLRPVSFRCGNGNSWTWEPLA